MAKHAWIQENLAAYLAGGLDAEEASRLEDHVAACPICARDLAEARQADQTLTALFSTALPDAGLEDRLVQGLRKARAQRFPQLRRYRMVAAAVAAVFLLALVGTMVSGISDGVGLDFPDLELRLPSWGHTNVAGMTLPSGRYLQREPQSIPEDSATRFQGAYKASDRFVADRSSKSDAKQNQADDQANLLEGDQALKYFLGGIPAPNSEMSKMLAGGSLGEQAAARAQTWRFSEETPTEGKDRTKEVVIAGNEVTKENVIRRQIGAYPGQTLTYPDLPSRPPVAQNEFLEGGKSKAELADSKANPQSSARNWARPGVFQRPGVPAINPAGGQGAGEDEDSDPFPPELQNSLGYYPPSQALVTKGHSIYRSNLGTDLTSTTKAGAPTAPPSAGPMGGGGRNPMGGVVEPPIARGPNAAIANGTNPGFGGPGSGFGGGGISGGIGGGIGGIGGGIGGIGGGINGGVTTSTGKDVSRQAGGAASLSTGTPVGKAADGEVASAKLRGRNNSVSDENGASGRGRLTWKESPAGEKLDYFKPNDVALGDAIAGSRIQASTTSSTSSDPAKIAITAFGNSMVSASPTGRGEVDKGQKENKQSSPVNESAQPGTAPRKIIIRTGEMDFEVESFDAATTVISLLVNPIPGAFIATTNSEKLPNGKVRGAVVVRCPPEHLDALVTGLRSNLAKSHGELKSQRIGSQDITKQYTDLESRLRAARTMQERLLQIIKTGKGEVKDLLNVEKELAVWGTKIEEMEGELRYFAHQVALSTLTITLTEKEIKAPYGVLDTEHVNMGIEVEDVEKAQTQTLAIVADVKGRITKSELKRLDAGQFNAVVNFEVPPDAAGPVRDRLKQLGNVARFDANRVMETEGGSGKPLDGKVTRKDAQFFLSLYNLANVAPREVTSFDVVSTDAEAAYQALLTRVQKLGGRIVTSNLNRQNNDQTIGTISFQVKANEADALVQELRAIGEVLRHQTVESPDTQNTTRSKRGFLVQILAMGAVPSRETTTMQLATADVPASYHKLREAIVAAKGRMLSAQLNEQSRQNATASLDFEVRREQEQAVRTSLASVGDVLSRNVTRVPENETALNSKVHLQVTLLDAARIPPREATSLGIETADVDAATSLFASIVRDAGGRTAESHAARERNGKVTAKLVFYVPLASAAEVVDRFKSAGVVRVQEKERNPQVADGPLAVARLDVTLSNSDLILAPDQGMWPQIRKGLTTSFVGLSWSLTVVIIGVLFVLPWVLVIYAVYRMVRWMRRTPQSA
jgi:glycine cleavage system regulatory protein/predicted anti-sigma-YlaC factor YlaD